MSRRRLLLLAGAAVVVAGLGVGGWLLLTGEEGAFDGARSAAGEPVRFPAPAFAHAPADSVARDDFVGAETCASCHAGQYEAWAGSTHGRAGGEPAADLLLAPFDGTPIRFADAVVIPRAGADNGYEFVVRQDGQDEVHYPVTGVVGGGHMLGGGTQGFFTRWVDGTERFVPWDWSRQEGRWFCNTGGRTEQGWVPISPGMRLAECGDWPPSRVLGTESRFANCQQCHGSQIGVSLVPGEGYRTERSTLRIDCESCHGPAREHVEWAREESAAAASGPAATDGQPAGYDPRIRSLADLPTDSSLATCFACHGLKDVMKEGYLPGGGLDEHFALKFPMLGDRPYTPDFRVRTFAYQATHLSSECYLDGPMDCVSCHEPHGQGYWDVNRRPLESPFDDGQCTACHASKAEPLDAHTFHPPDSEGSRCVNCHMPYLQHPEVGPGVQFARSDHTIPVPRPAFDDSLGIEGACVKCHAETETAELQRRAEAWWGPLKPHRPLVRGMLHREDAASRAEAAELLLRPDQTDPLAQFRALARFLVERLPPDAAELEPGIVERLEALSRSPDLDVRALALAALHWSGGGSRDVRAFLAERLETDAGDEATRRRWALALGFLGDHYRERGDRDRGRAAYDKALEVLPLDGRILQSLGILHTGAGDYASAIRVLERSLEADPERPLAWVNLGIARSRGGDPAGATRAYRRALELDPYEPLAHLNLGNAHQRAGRLEEAAASYERAVESDPGMARGHFELGRTLIRLQRYEAALPHARRAVEFDPSDSQARQMLGDLEQAVGGGR